MPGSEPTLLEALASAKLRPLLQVWSKRVFIDDQVDFLIDVNAKRPAKYLYTTYIAQNAPKLINIAGTTLEPIRKLAKEGDAGYAKMGKLLGQAASETITFLKPTYASTMGQGFISGVEYQRYLNAARDPSVGTALTSLKLPAAKAAALEPLLTLYLKARTVEDAYKAYLAMQKIAAKAKLDVALTAAGKSADDVTRDYQVLKLVAELKPMLAEAKRYLEGALKTIKAKGNSKNPIEVTRMFNSGRMRVEKVTTPYTKAARLDPGFAGKYGPVAAEKKKIDELWADYRKALGK